MLFCSQIEAQKVSFSSHITLISISNSEFTVAKCAEKHDFKQTLENMDV